MRQYHRDHDMHLLGKLYESYQGFIKDQCEYLMISFGQNDDGNILFGLLSKSLKEDTYE